MGFLPTSPWGRSPPLLPVGPAGVSHPPDAEGLVHTWLGSELQTLQFSLKLNIRCERFLRPEEEFWVWSKLIQGEDSSRLDQFPVDRYHNSCHLFWILEQLLQNSEVPCRVEPGSEQTGFLRHLEQHLLLLSDEFPLFSIYMWRIGSLLTSSGR
ncbi:unnamed protein product [Pleuronectes platessa]|uniref:Uncharacterized protein n=1 Tax=Pleuronectes platessa TaxID=8262 RepID=A0A9N7V0Y1_PLEPL|nr:unnamed protein product [Pleuronectes platessa]